MVWFGVAVAILGVLAVVLIVRAATRRGRGESTFKSNDPLGAVAACSGARRQGSVVTIDRSGLEVMTQCVTGKHARFWTTVTVPSSQYPAVFVPLDEEAWKFPQRLVHHPTITFQRAGRLARFWVAIGLNRDHQTGDAEFDREVHIDTMAEAETVSHVCRRKEVRDAIARLLDDGYLKVTVFERQSPLVVEAQRPPARATTSSGFAGQLELMVTIVGGLPQIEVERPGQTPVGRHAIVTALAVGVGVVGFFSKVITHGMWPEFGDALEFTAMRWGLFAVLLGLPALFLAVRGFTNSSVTFWVSALVLAIGLPLLAGSMVTMANAVFDDSPPRSALVEVTGTSSSSGKSGTTYYVGLKPKGAGGDGEEFVVSQHFYSCVHRGQIVTLTMREGALGWPWMDRVKAGEGCIYDW